MTNTSKFWVGALIVGAVAAGAVAANRARLNMAANEPPAASAEVTPAAPIPTPHRAPTPSKRAETSAEPVVTAEIAEVVKPLLQPGTDVTVASEGFATRESFVATAYAAKNLSIPFVVLKDRVVTQHLALASAIRQLKPDVNAKIEADRATAEARSEIARANG